MKQLEKAVIFLFVILSNSTLAITNEDQNIKNRLSFDSGYLTNTQTNRGMLQFGQDLSQTYGFFSKKLHTSDFYRDGGPLTQFSTSLVSAFLGLALQGAYGTSYHEFGHGSRIRAMGRRPVYYSDDVYAGHTFWDMFGDHLGNPFSGASTTYDLVHFLPKDQNRYLEQKQIGSFVYYINTDKADLIFSAGGINNEMQFASALSDRFYSRGGYTSEFIFYAFNKLSTIMYEKDDNLGNDKTAIINTYKKLGLDISQSTLNLYNLAAFMGSATTYNFIFTSFGMLGFKQNGKLKKMMLGNFRLPELDFYITSYGPSLKLRSTYKLNNAWQMDFAVEHVMQGSSKSELSLGPRLKLQYLEGIEIGANIIFGQAFAYSFDTEVYFHDNFSLALGTELYHHDSLHGERNIPSLEFGDTDQELWLRMAYYW